MNVKKTLLLTLVILSIFLPNSSDVAQAQTFACNPARQDTYEGDPVSFSVSGGSGHGYHWSALGGSPGSGDGEHFTTTYSKAGSYAVKVSEEFHDATCAVNVKAIPVPNSACISIAAPSVIAPGASFSATVVMKNTGKGSWFKKSTFQPYYHSLGSQNPANNKRWNLNRIVLPTSPIGIGSSATFAIGAKAPFTPGIYDFDWQMIQEGLGGAKWFGAICKKVISVGDLPTVSLTASPTEVDEGGTSVLTWTSAKATSCSSSGGSPGWTSPARPISGSWTTLPLVATATYTITCTGPGGTASASASVTVKPITKTEPPASPDLSVDLKANLGSGYVDGPVTGVWPLHDLDLRAVTSGSATGPITYKFFCDARETIPTITETIDTADNPHIREHLDLCDYEVQGTYTARVEVLRGGKSAFDTVKITVARVCAISVAPTTRTISLHDIVSPIWEKIQISQR